MRVELEAKLALFLKRQKGEETFARFARKVGLPQSTLHRLMHEDQSATLEKVEQILKHLKCTYQDVFGIELPSSSVQEKGTKPAVEPSPSGVKYSKKKPKSGS